MYIQKIIDISENADDNFREHRKHRGIAALAYYNRINGPYLSERIHCAGERYCPNPNRRSDQFPRYS